MELEEAVYRSDVLSSIRKYVGALSAWREVENRGILTPEIVRKVVSSNLYEKRVDLLDKLLTKPEWIKENLEIFLTQLERKG